MNNHFYFLKSRSYELIEWPISFVDTSINDNPIEFKTKRPFSPEEDILLLQSVKNLGNKWSLISKSFEDRTPTSLRQRYTRLRK